MNWIDALFKLRKENSMLELIGDVILMLCIILGIVVFATANVNYIPSDNKEEDKEEIE